jgi:hypothetical protein
MSPLRSTGTAATPESVELFWQHPASQMLEMTLHRNRLRTLALGRRLFVKLASVKVGQQADFSQSALETAHGNVKRLVVFLRGRSSFFNNETL